MAAEGGAAEWGWGVSFLSGLENDGRQGVLGVRGIIIAVSPRALWVATQSWLTLPMSSPRGGARQNDGGYSNDIFHRFFRQRDVRKFGPCQSAHDGGGRAKMTEATQTTFFRDFFGKEMSENSGLATQYLLVYSDAVPGSIFRRWSRPIKAFFTRSPWSGLSDFHLPHVCAV